MATNLDSSEMSSSKCPLFSAWSEFMNKPENADVDQPSSCLMKQLASEEVRVLGKIPVQNAQRLTALEARNSSLVGHVLGLERRVNSLENENKKLKRMIFLKVRRTDGNNKELEDIASQTGELTAGSSKKITTSTTELLPIDEGQRGQHQDKADEGQEHDDQEEIDVGQEDCYQDEGQEDRHHAEIDFGQEADDQDEIDVGEEAHNPDTETEFVYIDLTDAPVPTSEVEEQPQLLDLTMMGLNSIDTVETSAQAGTETHGAIGDSQMTVGASDNATATANEKLEHPNKRRRVKVVSKSPPPKGPMKRTENAKIKRRKSAELLLAADLGTTVWAIESFEGRPSTRSLARSSGGDGIRP